MKNVVKSILGASALSLFLVSASFAQDAQSSVDGQTPDVYTEDDSYTPDGTMQDGTAQDGTATQQEGIESETEGQLAQDGEMTQEENKVAVEKEELPVEVADAINDSQYADWSVSEVYEVTDQEEVVYEIHFANPEGQVEKESFTKNGETVAR